MNLIQFSILLETLGAFLIAFDIIVPKPWKKSVEKKIISWVQSGNRSKNAIFATVISVLIVIGWAVITDLNSSQGNTKTLFSLLFMLAGVFGGIALPLMVNQIVVLFWDIFRYVLRRPPATVDRGTMIFVITLVLSVIGLYVFVSAASLPLLSLVSVSVTFIITVAFLGAWINAVPLLQRFLGFDNNSVSRIGILVFIAAKLMQYGLA